MKTFKQFLKETYAKADGRWYDFKVDKLVYNGKMLRIYSGTRIGKELFETQIRSKGKWVTVQYANDFQEAKTVPTMDEYDRKYLNTWLTDDEKI